MGYKSIEIENLFQSFKDATVMIIGDVMIDSYLRGEVTRISPEAPVPIVALKKRESMLGGAANVALNIASLGGKAILCSVIGTDRQGEEYLALMKKQGLSTDGILKSENRVTTTKYRVIGNKMQMLRIDDEIDTDIDTDETQQLLNKIETLIKSEKPKVIILQDYNKGVLTTSIINEVIDMATHNNIAVAVDPKKKNFKNFKNISLFKPNLKEINEGLGITVNPLSEKSLQSAADILHNEYNIKTAMITLSENGVFISNNENGHKLVALIPAVVRNISDVSGAGDTVIGVTALCLASTTDLILTASLANLAGGIVCEQSGVVAVNKTQLLCEAKNILCK